MIIGLTVAQFTRLHVAISIAAIGSGFAVLLMLSRGIRATRIIDSFLWMTLLTSVTGFLFPFERFTPAIGVGIFSLLPLIHAFLWRYRGKASDSAAARFAISAAVALWLNLFVLVVQAFLMISALNALAPTGTEAPFLITQGLALMTAAALGVAAWRKAKHP